MEIPTESTPQLRRKNVAYAVLLISCIISIFAQYSSAARAASPNGLLIETIGFAALIFGAFYWFVARHQKLGMRITSGIAILFASALGMFMGVSSQHQRLSASVDKISDVIEGRAATFEATSANSPREEFMNAVGKTAQNIMAHKSNYDKGVTAAGTEMLLDANRLAADKNFTNTYTILSKLDKLFDTLSASIIREHDALRARVANIDLPTKNGLSKLDSNHTTEWLKVERKGLTHFRSMIDFLHAQRKDWRVNEDGLMEFKKVKNEVAWNNMIDTLNAIVAVQDEIIKDAEKVRAENFKLLKGGRE